MNNPAIPRYRSFSLCRAFVQVYQRCMLHESFGRWKGCWMSMCFVHGDRNLLYVTFMSPVLLRSNRHSAVYVLLVLWKAHNLKPRRPSGLLLGVPYYCFSRKIPGFRKLRSETIVSVNRTQRLMQP
uniref:Uncharacterized protein n=1 Tax=Trichuris muris TaxID=70415 RepID=A0A5S6PZ47_TRIMR